MMFKLFKKNKKGFTLVEVIVVLVILAILAAIMIPSMTGWIDKAKDESILVEARTALLAAQTLASEAYSKNPKVTAWGTAPMNETEFNALAGAGMYERVSGVELDGSNQITKLIYTKSATDIATYENGGWTVS